MPEATARDSEDLEPLSLGLHRPAGDPPPHRVDEGLVANPRRSISAELRKFF
jgi:hypothetical protein